MRAIVPRPAPTRALVVLTHGGSWSANIAGSSSHGSRLASQNARGNVADSSGAPCAGAAANSSSTKPSSLRRRLSGSSRAAARKSDRVVAAGMRRGEDHRDQLVRRTQNHHRGGFVRQGGGRRAGPFPYSSVAAALCHAAKPRVGRRYGVGPLKSMPPVARAPNQADGASFGFSVDRRLEEDFVSWVADRGSVEEAGLTGSASNARASRNTSIPAADASIAARFSPRCSAQAAVVRSHRVAVQVDVADAVLEREENRQRPARARRPVLRVIPAEGCLLRRGLRRRSRLGRAHALADAQHLDADHLTVSVEIQHDARGGFLGRCRDDAGGGKPDRHRIRLRVIGGLDHRLAPLSKWAVIASIPSPSGRCTTRSTRPPNAAMTLKDRVRPGTRGSGAVQSGVAIVASTHASAMARRRSSRSAWSVRRSTIGSRDPWGVGGMVREPACRRVMADPDCRSVDSAGHAPDRAVSVVVAN